MRSEIEPAPATETTPVDETVVILAGRDCEIRRALAALDAPSRAAGDSIAASSPASAVPTTTPSYGRVALERQLAQVRGALVRVSAGTFGLCVICSQTISAALLEHFPESPLCEPCGIRLASDGLILHAEDSRSPQATARCQRDVELRRDIGAGDADPVLGLLTRAFSAELDVDATFANDIVVPLDNFIQTATRLDRMWLAECNSELVGSIAVVATSAYEAQLRWFAVAPMSRRRGLGTRLLDSAIAFARRRGVTRLTASSITRVPGGGRLLGAAGFDLVDERCRDRWGTVLTEQRWVLDLSETTHSASNA